MTHKRPKDIQTHLAPDEKILWQGQPERWQIWLMLGFAAYISIFVVAFIIPISEALTTGDFSNLQLTINGTPVTDQTPRSRSILIWTLILVSGMLGALSLVAMWWFRREVNEFYAVTNKRALICKPAPFPKIVSLRGAALSRLEIRGSGKLRTLSFSYAGGNPLLQFVDRFSCHPNAFRHISDAPYVEDLISTNFFADS